MVRQRSILSRILAITFAISTTIDNLVFCKIAYSKKPPILTTPVIYIFPMEGKSFCKAAPGLIAPIPEMIWPTELLLPKQASMAIIKGRWCFS